MILWNWFALPLFVGLRRALLILVFTDGTMDWFTLPSLKALGFIDHNITVNIIKDDRIVEKKRLSLPKEIKNVAKCRNPRCITSIEQELDHIFVLTDPKKEVYRCKYCEEIGSVSHPPIPSLCPSPSFENLP